MPPKPSMEQLLLRAINEIDKLSTKLDEVNRKVDIVGKKVDDTKKQNDEIAQFLKTTLAAQIAELISSSGLQDHRYKFMSQAALRANRRLEAIDKLVRYKFEELEKRVEAQEKRKVM